MRPLTGLVALGLLASPLQAQTSFTGPADAIDGDSLTVGGIEVRLFGIDAPEGKQKCSRDGQAWPCGEAAAGKLRSLVEGQTVSCRARGRDAYGRAVSVCSAGGIELNRTMVAQGWATAFRAYAQDYVADEVRAKAARVGIWDSTFDLPADFRRQNEERAAAARPPVRLMQQPRASASQSQGCIIKGNHSRRGDWIYHLPGMPYYAQTRAEAMFCSEAEAQAAGYRRAIVR
ncbi:thermonuclease family protein [Tsuneonella troitsensis]|uniref:thermonuclease family protein n=1 Tax=Tsuneonella troitsensis TaxID=292222 RepID=UPI000708B356|nr:thermonuclease family protein [Tsuneonella troitsensis]